MDTMITARPAAPFSMSEPAFVLPGRNRPMAPITAPTALVTTGHLGYVSAAIGTDARVRDAKQAAPPRGLPC